jgi:hypothetical protein
LYWWNHQLWFHCCSGCFSWTCAIRRYKTSH